MKVRHLWCGIVLLCLMGLAVRAEVVVTTEEGNGADTYLTNDSQQGPDTVTSGEERIRAFRQIANSRSKTGFIRFDLNGIDGGPDNAIITFDATLLKGGSKSVDVYGLIDGSADFWNESTITYNTAPCMVPNPPTTLGNYKFVEGTVVSLGTLATPALPDGVVYPVPFSSTTTALPLGDFLKKDTNGFVTFVFIGTDNETEVASKEHATFNPPRLTLPNCYAVKRASNPVPANNIKVLISEYDVLSWTNPEPNLPGGVVTCDVYFGDKEPNALLPHYGLPLLAAGISGNSVPMPALSVYKTYYWVVDTYDTSRDPEYVQGKVWTFNTNNSAPVVNAGPDQYVWLSRTIIDTTSDADTYLRGETPRGSYEFMDIRGGSVDFAGYLRFNLSELTMMGHGTIKDAVLTLTVSGGASRNDKATNGRFALYGLNTVTGNTPQNWNEATLTAANAGQEWDGTVPMTTALNNGWITDLDDNVAGISEVISGTGDVGDTITISGAPLEAFLQSRVEDNGLVTFILANDDNSADRGYGIGTKENANLDYRPKLKLTYVQEGEGRGDAVVTLSGTVTDDGLPAGTYTVKWTQVSGPETIAIDPDDQIETTVTLPAAGWYEFQLEANDTELTGSDTVRVYVGIDPCDAAHQVPGYTPYAADLNDDCFVNLKDMAVMALQWLNCSSLVCP
ncbi:MAG TPA: DNRLRE domain-containing protein [Anaerohalosphaeraceae bacterium]|nr:DNRLRE domain-containing protein [Anaerohalosphaeraceae bacterium]HRT22777.1 DNRLRE domain-containing protein [Anaerohalosphaeraceae bacterium]